MLVSIRRKSNMLTKKGLVQMYRAWRRANGNRKPNRVIVKMRWEDDDNTDKGYQIDTIGLENMNTPWFKDNACIVWYSSDLSGLWELTKPGNGSDFVVTEFLEFYSTKR